MKLDNNELLFRNSVVRGKNNERSRALALSRRHRIALGETVDSFGATMKLYEIESVARQIVKKLKDFETLAYECCKSESGKFYRDNDFYDACREMVPKLLNVVKASKSFDSYEPHDPARIALRKALDELGQP